MSDPEKMGTEEMTDDDVLQSRLDALAMLEAALNDDPETFAYLRAGSDYKVRVLLIAMTANAVDLARQHEALRPAVAAIRTALLALAARRSRKGEDGQ